MRTDYRDAHYRHWLDAELLTENNRLANADHLYGVAAECGLKRLMQEFGMPFDPDKDKPQKRKDREHIDRIWDRYETYRSGHLHGASYGLPIRNPFGDWHVAQRYANRSEFNRERVARHRNGAEFVWRLIRQAERVGLI